MTNVLPLSKLPPCRPRYRGATALFVEPYSTAGGRRWRLQTERVFIKDGAWMVRRGGRLVPLASVEPQPEALDVHGEGVLRGVGEWWPDIDAFRAANGVEREAVDV